MKPFPLLLAVLFLFASVSLSQGQESFEDFVRKTEWPDTDFSKTLVDLDEIRHGGPPKDGIPAIDQPRFAEARGITGMAGTEPVISVEIGGKARAYPFRMLTRHEIVNDILSGVPIAVTYCPLCNSAIVFSRVVDGKVLDFGVTGWLRNSNLIMYDRQTESWWQEFTGEAIVGRMAGKKLEKVPARIESFAKFAKRHPGGDVLIPNRPSGTGYGENPYEGYDSLDRPYFPVGKLPENIAPMARVVSVGERAWALSLVRKKRRIETPDGLILTWEKGQNSALDTREIAKGKDVGNVLVRKRTENGLDLVPYSVDFAFAFHAFYPESPIVTD